jgi:hypothetical protein
MPDVVTQFCNLTGRTLSQLQAGQTLFTTTGGQTAVIRDVVIQSPKEVPLSLRVNGTEVAQVRGSALLTGTELVGVSSTVSLHTDEQPIFNGLYALDGGSSFFTSTCGTVFSGGLPIMGTLTGNSTTTSISSPSETPSFFCFDAAGNFYYSSVSGTTLYRRAGGVTGAQTTFSFGYCPVYDGSRYIYAIASGTQVVRFDTQTGTLAPAITLSGNIGFDTSYGQTCFIDGAMIVRNNYSSATIYVINLTTGVITSIGTFSTGSAQRFYIGAAKRANGDIIVIWLDYTNPGINWRNIGPNALSPVVIGSGSLNVTFGQYSSADNALFRFGTNFLGAIRSSTIQMFNVETMILSASQTISGMSTSSYAIPYLNAARAATDFGAVTVRATGILTT